MAKFKKVIDFLGKTTAESGVHQALSEVFGLPKLGSVYALRAEIENCKYQNDLEDFQDREVLEGICNYIIAARGNLSSLSDTGNFADACMSMITGEAKADIERMSVTVAALYDRPAVESPLFPMIYVDEGGNLTSANRGDGLRNMLSGRIGVDHLMDIEKTKYSLAVLMSKLEPETPFWCRVFDIANALDATARNKRPFILEVLNNNPQQQIQEDYINRVRYKKTYSSKVTAAGKINVIKVIGEVT